MSTTGTIVGPGKYTYEVNEDWAKLPQRLLRYVTANTLRSGLTSLPGLRPASQRTLESCRWSSRFA
jgi:hypothetical protein